MPLLSAVVIHCAEPATLAPFWSLVTGIPIVEDDLRAIAAGTLEPDESVLLHSPGGGLDVWITPAETLLPRGRIHLDVVASPAEVESFLAAGATVVAERERWTVLADPEGNEFCVTPGRH
jgi:Glyoxalase-like domain